MLYSHIIDKQNIRLSEIPGQGHWFDGIMSDDLLQEFLNKTLNPVQLHAKSDGQLPLPPLPDAFTISTLNPASTGSKGGIRILQLEVPYRYSYFTL